MNVACLPSVPAQWKVDTLVLDFHCWPEVSYFIYTTSRLRSASWFINWLTSPRLQLCLWKWPFYLNQFNRKTKKQVCGEIFSFEVVSHNWNMLFFPAWLVVYFTTNFEFTGSSMFLILLNNLINFKSTTRSLPRPSAALWWWMWTRSSFAGAGLTSLKSH